MTIYKRFLLLICGLLLLTVLLIAHSRDEASSTRIWRHGTQRDEQDALINIHEEEEQVLAMPRLPEDPSSFVPSQGAAQLHQAQSQYPKGKPKPHGSTYTKAVVVGRLLSEDTDWLDTANLSSSISKHIYLSERKHPKTRTQSQSFLTLPKPKGHEAIVYLTYIIDNYASLPDISIFLHAHQHAWHNPELLNHDAAEILHRLSAEHVTREGYMNLRCHWKPGCPEYIHPQTDRKDKDKLEEGAMASAWAALFPSEPVPDVLAAPCCAQFAVSRERILSIPLATFKEYRAWLLATKLDDYTSGRVFEYLWHKIFTGENTWCPDMRACYCDGYGVCFEGEREFDYWFELRWREREAWKRLEAWRAQVRELRGGRRWWWGFQRPQAGKVPARDGDVVILREIDGLKGTLEEMRLRALLAGTDPRVRARIAGREWKDGDGY